MQQKKPVKLTDQQTKVMSAEYNMLFEQALQQLFEHKGYLTRLIQNIQHPEWDRVVSKIIKEPTCGETETYRKILLDEISQLKIVTIQAEPNVRDMKGNHTLSAVYEYPDVLYTFLTHEATPDTLRATLRGGINIDDVEMERIKRVGPSSVWICPNGSPPELCGETPGLCRKCTDAT